MAAKEGGWEFGISRCKLIYIGEINNTVLVYRIEYLLSISCDKP